MQHWALGVSPDEINAQTLVGLIGYSIVINTMSLDSENGVPIVQDAKSRVFIHFDTPGRSFGGDHEIPLDEYDMECLDTIHASVNQSVRFTVEGNCVVNIGGYYAPDRSEGTNAAEGDDAPKKRAHDDEEPTLPE